MTEVDPWSNHINFQVFLSMIWHLRRHFIMDFLETRGYLWLHDNLRHAVPERNHDFLHRMWWDSRTHSRCFDFNNPWGHDPVYHWMPLVIHLMDQFYINLIWVISKVFLNGETFAVWFIIGFCNSFFFSFLSLSCSPFSPLSISDESHQCLLSFILIFPCLGSSNFHIDSLGASLFLFG